MSMRFLACLSLLLFVACDDPPSVDPPDNSSDAAGRISDTALTAHFLRIRMASDKFRSVNGAYPKEVGQLVDAGFIHAGQELDPWDHPFALGVEDGTLVITCYGADGKPGGTAENQDRVSSHGVALQ